MLAVSIVFAAFLFILFLIVGVIGGWVARDYMMNYQEVEKVHPEMYDRNGNIVPDEIVAFRFENYDNNDEEDDTQSKNGEGKGNTNTKFTCKSICI